MELDTTTVAAIKDRARATWAAGDFDVIAERIRGVGRDLVLRVGVGPDDRVLDVACGTGNATIPAAKAGATVTGLDLTPELLEGGRRHAAQAGVEIEWVEGDAEALPFDAGGFDVVLSTFGCMFAPRHEVAAGEIARVMAPGGRFGVAAWTPTGSIGDFFKTLSALGPPPPPGFQPPILWGTREHVEQIFAGKGIELEFQTAAVEWNFESIDEAIDEYYDLFGPIVMLRAALEPEGRGHEIRDALRGVFERWNTSSGDSFAFPGAYLVALGRKVA